MRASARSGAGIFRFKQWRHYTAAFALALAAHDEGDVLFVSNDMIVTPTYLIALLAVAGLAPRAGIVRGTANFVDAHPQHSLQPNVRQLGVGQIEAFALERPETRGGPASFDFFDQVPRPLAAPLRCDLPAGFWDGVEEL